jgi:hypothetical protein
MLTQEEWREIANNFKGLSVVRRQEILNSATRVITLWDTVQCSVDIPKRQVTAPMMTSYEMNLNGMRILPQEIELALDAYMARWQAVGRMHIEVTENYPVRVWFDGYQAYMTMQIVDDADWANITNGVYKGTSWAGISALVDIPVELAQELGIQPGAWLFDIEMVENSLVDIPAVPAAVFNALQKPVQGMTVTEQLTGGIAKPRKLSGKLPDKYNLDKPHANSFFDRLRDSVTTAINTIARPAGGGLLSIQEDDMAMSPEELAAFNELSNNVAALTTTVGTLVESIAKQTEAAEEATEIVLVENKPALTAEDLTAAIVPLTTEIASLKTELEAVKNTPVKSGELREIVRADGGEEGVAISSLPADDPRRIKALNGG